MAIKRHKTAGLEYSLPAPTCVHCGGRADIPEPVPISSQLGSRCLPSESSRYWCWDCWDGRKVRDWRERSLEEHLYAEIERQKELGSGYRSEAVLRVKKLRVGGTKRGGS